MFQPYYRCSGISTDPSWKDIETAPRDGTVIELENCYGIRPFYSLCRWVENRWGFSSGGWIKADDENSGTSDGPWLRWRKYEGDPRTYIDPTRGAQVTMEYWR